MTAKITMEYNGKKVTIINFTRCGGINVVFKDTGVIEFGDLFNNIKITKDMTQIAGFEIDIDIINEIERMNHPANGLLTEKKRCVR